VNVIVEILDLSTLMGIAGSTAGVLMPSQILMLLALPLTLLLAAVEWRHFRHGHEYDLKDSLASTIMGGSYVLLAEGLIIVAVVVPLFNWIYQFRLTTLEITPASLVVLFLLVDLCFYLFHLAAHRIRFFWAVHEVHHGSEYFNFTVAFRQSVMYAVTGVYLFFLPAVLLGFKPEWVLVMLAANMTYQIFVHTQWVKRLPAPIEWLFNTPSNHRAHHGRNPRYIDRNLGGVLMVWDHLFATYVAEDPADPPDYGVVRQIHSHNPLKLTFHEWGAMLSDVARPGPLALRLKHLWASPEWQRPVSAPADKADGAAFPVKWNTQR
jgi:sterol desaturase/sphingolipid hydroxylase (fatty acid hydroxylase superfamily)